MPTEWRDLLWFLLPVAAASGWFAARRITTNPGRVVSAEYRRGVSYLLNEQPDRAIEIFTRLMDADVDTIEIHLALGSVFRRRGEVERAIRIHQGLVSGSALDPAQRSHALCELALDYQKAGLLDRAETLFEELTQIPEHTDQALRSLIHIYEQEKDWDKVSVVARRLMSVSGTEQYGLLAQYRCEMAEVALNRNDFTSADRFMREALALDPRCARAHHLAGQAAAAQGDDRRAIAAWQEIEYLDPAFLDEVVHYI
ncbi:MAG: tetratricopeptide repeat protein, partial [Gammaproteobacteria bacterium]|nr:tetratricopeptide repeat protein [Gammaproteobacteria bacterium]